MYNCNGFDKVTHKRLLFKLNNYGIEYNTLKWIEGFLTSCTQTVIIEMVYNQKNSHNIWRSSRNSFGSYSVPCVYNDFGESIKHSTLVYVQNNTK
jgi:hypothetical protein